MSNIKIVHKGVHWVVTLNWYKTFNWKICLHKAIHFLFIEKVDWIRCHIIFHNLLPLNFPIAFQIIIKNVFIYIPVKGPLCENVWRVYTLADHWTRVDRFRIWEVTFEACTCRFSLWNIDELWVSNSWRAGSPGIYKIYKFLWTVEFG